MVVESPEGTASANTQNIAQQVQSSHIDDSVKPSDSVSQTESTSSIRAQRAKAAAKMASLEAKLEAFDEEARLRKECAETQAAAESKLKKHQLKSEIEAAKIEHDVLASFEQEGNSVTFTTPKTPKTSKLPLQVLASLNKRKSTPQATRTSTTVISSTPVVSAQVQSCYYPVLQSNSVAQPIYSMPNPVQANPVVYPVYSSLNPTAAEYVPPPAVHKPPEDNRLTQQQMMDILSLPKSTLIQFDGDPMNYFMFINSFNSYVESAQVSDVVKLNKLLELCKGKALNVIKPCACMPPSVGYKKAKELLAERFGNDYVISETWITKLTSGPPIKGDNVTMLQDFVDDIRSCTETLRAMGHLEEVDSRVRLVKLVKRLPIYLQNRWRKFAVERYDYQGKYPTIDDFLLFLTKATREVNDPVFGLPAKEPNSDTKFDKNRFTPKSVSFQIAANDKTTATTEKQNNIRKCFMCGDIHYLHQCERFRKLSDLDRLRFVIEKKICFNCLNGTKHMCRDCRFQHTCGIDGCTEKHSRLLHNAVKKNFAQVPHFQVKASGESHCIEAENTEIETLSFSTLVPESRKISLPIVPVYVRGPGQPLGVKTFALLDSGSNRTFCSKNLQQLLGVEGKQSTLTISTLNNSKEIPVEEISISASNAQSKSAANVVELSKVYVVNDFPPMVSSVVCSDDISKFSHLADLPVSISGSEAVMLLIGQDNPEALIPLELRRGKYGEPYGVRTPLGWTVNGPVKEQTESQGWCNYIHAYADPERELNTKVEQFWKVDSYGSKDESIEMSVNDRKVIKLWDTSVQIDDNHYQLDIPFKNERPNFPDNRSLAEKRLGYLGRRLVNDETLHSKYTDGINDLLKKGYAEKVEGNDVTPGLTWYIPHHPVFNVNKPDKLRIVYDCAAMFQNTCLNKEVLQGPDLTNKLIGVLLRFRENKIGLMADIEAMFYQIRVTPRHRDVLRFLWWKDSNPHNPIETYRMTVHLFGGVWCPSISSYALKKTAEEFKGKFDKRVVDSVLNNFYVDDLLQSTSSDDEGIFLARELRNLLQLRGFNLTKWISNSRRILESIPQEHRAKKVQDLDLQKEELPLERALGVEWITERDVFSFKVNVKQPVFTRRGLLSVVSAVYDPLGIVCPFVLTAKQLFQNECKLQKSWDDPLEDTTAKQFTKWLQSLELLKHIEVPRCVVNVDNSKVNTVQLHHFCDSSETAYGTATYLRVIDNEGKISCSFLFGKSRLSPIKQLSIPRLELCAAVVAVNVNKMIQRELRIHINEVFFWTDSSIVLYYINNASRRFQTFVANRLTVIHDGSSVDQWRHVSSSNNPADDATRGLKPNEISQRWLNGPAYLHMDECSWPESKIDLSIVEESSIEVKRTATSYATETSDQKSPVDDLIGYYSDWFRLKKGVAWLLRFISWLQKKKVVTRQLLIKELKTAEICIIKYVQTKCFREELKDLKSHQKVKRNSSLYKLEPFLDEQGLLRVGGRLSVAVIAFEMKHQLIIPREHHIASVLLRYIHELEAGHSGTEYVLSMLRIKYWIPKARNLIRKVIRACVICKRLYEQPMSQKMSDLPSDRVNYDKPPFTNIGIDCFGPFYVKRGRSQEKRYGCIFTCLTFRAIHIEMLHTLDSDSFVNALQRFISRRGTPEVIRSDNGTNFVGGSRELFDAMKRWNEKHKVHTYLQHKDIQWIFNPPCASHMGGVWERQIRTVRKVMNAIIRNAVLDDERLNTLFCEIESIVNNRPITRCPDSPQDVSVLTPNHLLLLRSNSTPPKDFFAKRDLYTRRWRHVQYLADRFWKRWVREYLPIIQTRQKWLKPNRDLQENDIVLVVDELTPRNTWPMARVTKVNRSRDGHVRSAVVQTKSSSLTRPVTKLCMLEPCCD